MTAYKHHLQQWLQWVQDAEEVTGKPWSLTTSTGIRLSDDGYISILPVHEYGGRSHFKVVDNNPVWDSVNIATGFTIKEALQKLEDKRASLDEAHSAQYKLIAQLKEQGYKITKAH